jgi:hypothetical protein
MKPNKPITIILLTLALASIITGLITKDYFWYIRAGIFTAAAVFLLKTKYLNKQNNKKQQR